MKEKYKNAFKQLLQYLKRPSFLVCFIVVWLLLESPLIVGLIMYVITQKARWLAVAGSWYALTAAPLPIPVLPLSIACGIAGERLINKLIYSNMYIIKKESKYMSRRKITDKQLQELMLIYMYRELNKNNAALFDEIVRQNHKFEYDFKAHTEQENRAFLTQWKHDNNIDLRRYRTVHKVGLRYAKNGTPILVSGN